MRKLFILAFVIGAFFLAAAFRLITRPAPVGGKDLKGLIALKRQSLLSCRVAPDDGTDPIDIPPLTGWGPHRWKITTTSDSAQFYFDQGINMYYGFHTLEARASFAKAIRFDSSCAMAWYGKALAMGPTINFGNGFRAEYAAFVAAQTGVRLSGSGTPLEKGLIEAMAVRYSADTAYDLKRLQEKYNSSMKALAASFPKNADVVSLYADALMLEHPWDLYDAGLQPRPWTPEIRSVLEKALVIDSLHPGALHFMIHTLEGSLHPEEGIKSAEVLADLMPDVAHVVHMPSHIYIRTGHYKKGIDVNNRAVKGYDQYLNLYAPVSEGSGLYLLHAVHMEIACAMMAGDYATALHSSDTIRQLITAADLKIPGAFGSFVQYVYAFRPLTLLRFGKWDMVLAEPAADTSLAYSVVLDHFTRGMALSHLSRLADAERELRLLRSSKQVEVLKIPNDPFSSAYDASVIAEGILAGVIAEEKKDYAAARQAFQQAVAAEDALVYTEPRDWPLPARQYLGDLLLKMGNVRAAVEVFEKDLAINPKNGWSLTGLQLAYKALKDVSGLRRVNAELEVAWQIRDQPVKRPVF